MYELFKKLLAFGESYLPQGRVWMNGCDPTSNLFRFFQPSNLMFKCINELLNRLYKGFFPCQTNILRDEFIGDYDLLGGFWSVPDTGVKSPDDTIENDMIVAKYLMYDNSFEGYKVLASHYGVAFEVEQEDNPNLIMVNNFFDYCFPIMFNDEFIAHPNCVDFGDIPEYCGNFVYSFPFHFGECEFQPCANSTDCEEVVSGCGDGTEHCNRCSKCDDCDNCENGWTPDHIKDSLKARAFASGLPTTETITTTETIKNADCTTTQVVQTVTKDIDFNLRCECELNNEFVYDFPMKFGDKEYYCYTQGKECGEDYYHCARCESGCGDCDVGADECEESNICPCRETPNPKGEASCVECPYTNVGLNCSELKCVKIITKITFFEYSSKVDTIEKIKQMFEELKPLGVQFEFIHSNSANPYVTEKFCYVGNMYP